MKTVIIFASTHHGNTKTVVEYMAKSITADLIDITQNQNPDISAYDIIGFASGIYFHSFHESIPYGHPLIHTPAGWADFVR